MNEGMGVAKEPVVEHTDRACVELIMVMGVVRES